jgi:MerR family mercuric resistance operon transcriptional regulator
MNAEKPLSIGALAQTSGVPIETIRYYERIGLLPAPHRSPAGYRAYTVDDVRRLSFVRRARELGFSLSEVRALLSLAAQPGATCAEVRDLAAVHVEEIRRKLRDLKAMQRVLDEMIGRCERGESPDCPIIHALSDTPERGKSRNKGPKQRRAAQATPGSGHRKNK